MKKGFGAEVQAVSFVVIQKQYKVKRQELCRLSCTALFVWRTAARIPRTAVDFSHLIRYTEPISKRHGDTQGR